jgi:hypothetical protein
MADDKLMDNLIAGFNDMYQKKIAPIQSRINAAIEEVRKQISSIESRISEIDTELTNPRYISAELKVHMKYLES